MSPTPPAPQGSAGGHASPPGLREHSKAKRRRAIQQAALRLFAERGYEATTIADIADAAEVAPRTVTGYFPSKVELATSYGDEVAERITSAFDCHPEADFLSALWHWLDEEERLVDQQTSALALAMYDADRSLGAIGNVALTQALDAGTTALARELGLPAESPLVNACAAAVIAVSNTYLHAIMRGEQTSELREWTSNYLRILVKAAAPGES
ncbi:TetR/AcrR family transcriptional regulator [Streptomyces zaomyceticus]|uniref:TetR/AcrR family transcriptional regulator n=1 Tax=Streptomyces zaomyceticus TaxID=68286 RepID=UPI0034270B54